MTTNPQAGQQAAQYRIEAVQAGSGPNYGVKLSEEGADYVTWLGVVGAKEASWLNSLQQRLTAAELERDEARAVATSRRLDAVELDIALGDAMAQLKAANERADELVAYTELVNKRLDQAEAELAQLRPKAALADWLTVEADAGMLDALSVLDRYDALDTPAPETTTEVET